MTVEFIKRGLNIYNLIDVIRQRTKKSIQTDQDSSV